MSLIDHANDVIDRLEVLNTTPANACAFLALLERTSLGTRREKSRRIICDFFSKKPKAI
jgi:hypothetical protein